VEKGFAQGASKLKGRAYRFDEGSLPRRSLRAIEPVGQVFCCTLKQTPAFFYFRCGFPLRGHPSLSKGVVSDRSSGFRDESITPPFFSAKPVGRPDDDIPF
jgi:hypothetical protein